MHIIAIGVSSMCGIVGLFLKDKALEPKLGAMLSTMLGTMCDRGPDSAGFAVYGAPRSGVAKITLQSPNPGKDFADLEAAMKKVAGPGATLSIKSTHAVLSLPADKADDARAAIKSGHPSVRVMGTGDAIEIYKEVGYPTDVSKQFDLAHMTGTHAIGHTRMATESAVSPAHAHPADD